MTPAPPPLRIAFVPGVTVRKWTQRWEERHPRHPLEVAPVAAEDGVRVVREREAELAFVRLPIERDGLSVIRLYGEAPVVVVSRDHEFATRESVTIADIAELNAVEYPPRESVKDAVALVAAGVGAIRLPHSLARLHARKDIVAIPIVDAPETDIAVIWLADETTAEIEEFVGIVRGRTESSSRGTPTPPAVKKPVRKQRPVRTRSTARKRQGR